MKNDSKALRNIVLISQLAICVMVPTFLCLALGIWLDKRFGTWFTVPLLFIGMAAGARNAYVLAMNTVRQEKAKKVMSVAVYNHYKRKIRHSRMKSTER